MEVTNHLECLDLETRQVGPNDYEITIAANNRAGGQDVSLKDMDLNEYMKNPVVLLDHGFRGHSLPIARTLKLTRRSNSAIRAKFEFLTGDDMAGRVKNAWDKGFIRAASIGWERDPETNKLYLREWSLVSVPADRDAVRSVAQTAFEYIIQPPSTETRAGTFGNQTEKEVELDQKDVDKLVAESLKKLGIQTDKPDQPQQVSSETIRSAVTEATNTAFAQMKEAQEKAEADRKAAEKATTEVREKANFRAQVIAAAKPHLDESVDINSLSDREIMVRALGDSLQVTDAMSDDYILGRFETHVATNDGQRSGQDVQVSNQQQLNIPQHSLNAPQPSNAGLQLNTRSGGLPMSHLSVLDQIRLRNDTGRQN